MDPLSEVLSLLVPRSYGAGGFDMGGEWSIGFDRHPGFKCYAVANGQCWLSVDDVAEPLFLETGDCVILSTGRPFRLASDLALPPVPYTSLPKAGGIATGGAGGGCLILGGHFALSELHAGMLLDALSPIVLVREDPDKAMLRSSLAHMRRELVEQNPGASLIAQQLAHTILVQALRLHLADSARAGTGWLYALAERRIGAAIEAVHANPGDRWTLHALAARAGMSRSGFALRFKELTGDTPIEYITRWRMLLASDRLAAGQEPIVTVARSLGYESESAFSTAFKRTVGCSPRRYGRGARPLPRSTNGQVLDDRERKIDDPA